METGWLKSTGEMEMVARVAKFYRPDELPNEESTTPSRVFAKLKRNEIEKGWDFQSKQLLLLSFAYTTMKRNWKYNWMEISITVIIFSSNRATDSIFDASNVLLMLSYTEIA